MRVRFTVELHEQADRLELPWTSPDEPSNRYYDLRAEPDKLRAVVEAREQPALGDFLRRVNAPAGLFATAKCDYWQTREFTREERAAFPDARWKQGSYIDLVFARPEFNFDRRHYEQLARRLQPLLEPRSAAAQAEFCLRHCLYRERSAWGFYFTVFLFGYGSRPDEAERQWAAGLAALAGALEKISSILAQAVRARASPPGS